MNQSTDNTLEEPNIEAFLAKTGDIEFEVPVMKGKFVFRRPGIREKLRIASLTGYSSEGNTVIDWERAAEYILPLTKEVPPLFAKLMQTEDVKKMNLQRFTNLGIAHDLLITVLMLFLNEMNATQGALEAIAEK